MTNEGENRTRIERPKFTSPYFSYELQDLSEIRALVDHSLDGMEFSSMQLSPDTPGLLNEVSLTKSDGDHIKLATSFKIPWDYGENFFRFPQPGMMPIKFLMSEPVKRGFELQQTVKKHLSDTSNLDFNYRTIRRVRGNTILGDVAYFPGQHVEFTFTAQTDAQFQRQLDDFFTIAFAYGTMIYEAMGLDEPHSKAVISPVNFIDGEYKKLSPWRIERLLKDPRLKDTLALRIFRGEDAKQAAEDILLELNEEGNPHMIRGENVIDFRNPSNK